MCSNEFEYILHVINLESERVSARLFKIQIRLFENIFSLITNEKVCYAKTAIGHFSDETKDQNKRP